MGKVSKNARASSGKKVSGGKDMVKVVIPIKSAKSGSYTFKEVIVHKDKLKETLAGGNQ
jgi:hypothetical protein